MKNDQNMLPSTLTVQEDHETGDLYLLFPQLLLDQVGWKEGDTINWEKNDNGSWTLSKKNV